MLHHSPVLNATLAGRAPSSHVLAKETLTFQSAYPRGTQYPTQFRDTTWNGCFNPRARVGHDAEYLINAGTNGSFNPRARVGRDASHYRPPSRKPWFQSTRPRGARPLFSRTARSHSRVSIHAPAWGATTRYRWTHWYDGSFNPRARVGRDVWPSLKVWPRRSFQSTRPRGARHRGVNNIVNVMAFQSTRPRGARPAVTIHSAPN